MTPDPTSDDDLTRAPSAHVLSGAADPSERFIKDSGAAAAVPIRQAATVMLVRDGTPNPRDGSTLEVCMLRRNLQSTFVGGVHVFPGGAVDPADGDDAVTRLCDGRTPAEADAAGGLAFWVASIRETFEEAGLLPASWADDGEPLRFDDDRELALRFARHRRAVDRGERLLADVLDEEGLRLDLTGTHYVSRWITPLGLTRRYDTRFFIAAAPAGQSLAHDGREAIAAEWHRPGSAIEQHAGGTMIMRTPTVASLHMLARSGTVAEALAAAAAIGEVPTIEGPPRLPGQPGEGRLPEPLA